MPLKIRSDLLGYLTIGLFRPSLFLDRCSTNEACYFFQVLSASGSAAEQNEIMEFFKGLVDVLMDRGDANARLDFLACSLSANIEGAQVLRSLEEYIKVCMHILSYIVILSSNLYA